MKSFDLVEYVEEIRCWLSIWVCISLISIVYVDDFVLSAVFDNVTTVHDFSTSYSSWVSLFWASVITIEDSNDVICLENKSLSVKCSVQEWKIEINSTAFRWSRRSSSYALLLSILITFHDSTFKNVNDLLDRSNEKSLTLTYTRFSTLYSRWDWRFL